MMSYREGFWNGNLPSKKTQWGMVTPEGRITSCEGLSSLRGKKVLVLVHGFCTPKEAVLKNYFSLKEELLSRSALKTHDVVLGIVWPAKEWRYNRKLWMKG